MEQKPQLFIAFSFLLDTSFGSLLSQQKINNILS